MVGLQRDRVDGAAGVERGDERHVDAGDPEPCRHGRSVGAERRGPGGCAREMGRPAVCDSGARADHGSHRDGGPDGAAAARDDDPADCGGDGRDRAGGIQVVGLQRNRVGGAAGVERIGEFVVDAGNRESCGHDRGLGAQRRGSG